MPLPSIADKVVEPVAEQAAEQESPLYNFFANGIFAIF